MTSLDDFNGFYIDTKGTKEYSRKHGFHVGWGFLSF